MADEQQPLLSASNQDEEIELIPLPTYSDRDDTKNKKNVRSNFEESVVRVAVNDMSASKKNFFHWEKNIISSCLIVQKTGNMPTLYVST